VLEQDHTGQSATDTSPRLHFSPTPFAQEGLALRSSSNDELFHSKRNDTHSPTRIASQVEVQIPPLQRPAAVLGKSNLNPEIAFNDPTADYFKARPSSIFQDIAFDDEPFYQLFGNGAASSMDGASEWFVSGLETFPDRS
jgi:hypothetical protein